MANFVNFQYSVLCADCNAIGEDLTYCACCGSQSIFNLARVLERDAIAVRKEVAAIMGIYADVMQERIFA